MTIRLLYFAALKEMRGTSGETCELQTGDTPVRIADRILGFHTTLLFAVNDELVPGNHLLADGDLLAFIPPMAGG